MLRAGAVGLACTLGALGGPGALVADDDEGNPRFRGLLFGDFYHVASHHTPQGEGATGVVLRRGYLTLDGDFSEDWYGRARVEVNQSGEFETYEFDAGFKDLFVGWKVGRHRLLFGLSPTPTFDLIESVWGLRYLVRTPLDLQGVASRDTGVAASGPLNAGGTLRYRAMGGAGLEFGNETGDGRKWMGALTWKPSPPWSLDLYVDHETLRGPFDRSTFQIFVGYRTDTWRWGAQYSHQDRQDDPTLQLASAFAVRRAGKRLSLVGRIDRVIKPSPKGDNISYIPFDPRAPATFLLGGLECRAAPHLVVTPNLVVITYDRNDQGVRPRRDVQLRLTVFLDLE